MAGVWLCNGGDCSVGVRLAHCGPPVPSGVHEGRLAQHDLPHRLHHRRPRLRRAARGLLRLLRSRAGQQVYARRGEYALIPHILAFYTLNISLACSYSFMALFCWWTSLAAWAVVQGSKYMLAVMNVLSSHILTSYTRMHCLPYRLHPHIPVRRCPAGRIIRLLRHRARQQMYVRCAFTSGGSGVDAEPAVGGNRSRDALCVCVQFVALLFLLLSLEVAAAVVTLVVRVNFLGSMEGRLVQQLADRYGRNTHNNSAFTEAVDLMQFKVQSNLAALTTSLKPCLLNFCYDPLTVTAAFPEALLMFYFQDIPRPPASTFEA
ncbi:hypothetical protein PR048_006896 [Dryococelus australis]|uniref:Uncharacterized protein n=1 Tax=Dryococelus australis TaxID=614101 RepID=A0ABQ9IC71_9NEOP|nr:hypothetical protein PR048_006896 [Dryococelus australis]